MIISSIKLFRDILARATVLFASFLFSVCVHASPWTATDDYRLRASLQQLNDAGVINTVTTSWPIHWTDIERSLEKGELDQIERLGSGSLSLALSYVRKQLKKNKSHKSDRPLTYSDYEVSLSNTTELFRAYGDSQMRDAQVAITHEWARNSVSAGLTVLYASDPYDQAHWRLDGSYLSATVGNWNLAVGATERWWGPGWQSSLILSNNARPIPAVSISRIQSIAPKSKWLSWIGPWHMSSFIGQLESDRSISKALLFGMRLTFKPIPSLELGFSRAAQWGGKGRSQSFGELVNVFVGKDENQVGGPGNQLGGFDARYSWMAASFSQSVYGQLIGEDEAGLLPSKYIYIVGSEINGISIENYQLSIFLEYADTLSGRIVRDERPNTAYEHSVYTTGYRYHGRVLGSSFDNDSRGLTFGGLLVNAKNNLWKFSISQLNLNEDGLVRGNQVSKTHHKMQHVTVSHQRLVRAITVDLGIEWNSTIPNTDLADDDRFGLYFNLKYEFK